VLVGLAFQPALGAEFQSWDDEANILWNHQFRGLDGSHVEWMFTTVHMGPYQPLAWLSLAIDHALWGLGGPDRFPEAPWYHLTSVAIHALAAVAFFFLARRLLARFFGRTEVQVDFAAFLAAAFFAVHPLRVESVAWVTERRDVLCGLFYVLALRGWLAYADARGDRPLGAGRLGSVVAASLGGLALLWSAIDLGDPTALALRSGGVLFLAGGLSLLALAAFAAANAAPRAFAAYLVVLALFLGALLSKGLAFVLPGVALLLDAWPLRRARDTRGVVSAVVEKLPLVVLAVLFARIAIWGQASSPSLIASMADHPLGERVLQAGYGLVFYLRKTLLPVSLSPYYELPDTLRLSEPRFFLSLLAVAAVTIGLFLVRKRAPALLAGWVAYAISIAPVLGFSQTGPQIVADRYSYLACLPFALLAGGAVLGWNLRGPLAAAVPLAVVAVLAGATFAQSRAWRNSTTLWEHAVAIDPDVGMNLLNLGHARVREAERAADKIAQEMHLDEARRLFERGLAVREHPLLHSGLARVFQYRWEIDPKHPPELAQKSLEHARRALEIAKLRNVETPVYHLDLGAALGNAGHPNESLAELEFFVRERPDMYLGHAVFGLALLQNQRYAEAVRELERAVELEPGAVNAWGNLGIACERQGEKGNAIGAYQRVLALSPGHPAAKQRLFMLQSRVTVDVVPK